MKYRVFRDVTIPDEPIYIPIEDEEEVPMKNYIKFYNPRAIDDFIIQAHKNWAEEGQMTYGQMCTDPEVTEYEKKRHEHCQALADFSDIVMKECSL